MAKKSSAQPTAAREVHGTVLGVYQRPLGGARVEAFDKELRGERRLGDPTRTATDGSYRIAYGAEAPNEADTEATSEADGKADAKADRDQPDVFVRVYGEGDKVLQESPVNYNAAAQLQIDLNLSPVPYPGPSEFENALKAIRRVSGKLPLAELTEDKEHQDLTFLASKTGLDPDAVSAMAMAFRFEQKAKVPAVAFYGLLRQGPPKSSLAQLSAPAASAPSSFTAQTAQAFQGLMQQDIATLMSTLQAAIGANLIPYAVNADVAKIQAGLAAQLKANPSANPAPTSPATLTQKLSIAGLQGSQISTFVSLFSKNTGTPQAFWTTLAQNPQFQEQQISLLQAVFSLSQLTGEQMVLTDQLIKATNVKTPADLSPLAAKTSQDWLSLLTTNKITPPAGTPGATLAAQQQNYASTLEANFTSQFPTAAFAARVAADAKTLVPLGAAIGQFLAANPSFDLLKTRIGTFLGANPPAAGSPAAAPVAPATAQATPARGVLTGATPAQPPVNTAFVDQLKRTQRLFKLAPTYAAANTLLGDGLDSAQKIYRAGAGNFTTRYATALGAPVAQQVFQKARKAYAQALALTGNLKSLSDASHVGVFPNYTDPIEKALLVEVPDLTTLFGSTDFCECDDCNAVDGEPAYLADALHYLDNRLTSITSGSQAVSVKQALLARRPDVAYLDLDCDNTNVEVPYIDIANELLEDFIVPPQVTLPAALVSKLIEGTIDPSVQSALIAQLQSAGFTNLAALVTVAATVSASYQATRYTAGNLVTETHWTVRDQFAVLTLTQQSGGILAQLTHQTLLTQDEISANPEYVNLVTYANLKAVQRPVALPFDLFEAEGEAYLAKLGTRKADLIDVFREEHDTSGPPTQADLDMAYAYLGVNETERTLIFKQDLLNQTNYWGSLASGTSAELDLFMAAASLTYDQVLQLLALKTINPALDSAISSADLSCDLATKTVTNLTPAKFDIIHRFLRLWRKTTLALDELDAIVQCPALGNGGILPVLAPQLQAFLTLQGQWSLTAYRLLAFFGNIDTTAPNDLYDQLFQNRAVTNPLNPDFAVAQVTSATPIPISAVDQGLIAGAVNLAAADLASLVAQTDGKLSLANLSLFFRTAQLAASLGVTIADLQTIAGLVAISPFTDPMTTQRFVTAWSAAATAQFSAGDLNFLLRDQDDPTAPRGASDQDIASALADLQSKLLQAQAQAQPAADPNGQLLQKWLTDPTLGWNAALVAKLLDILGTQDDTEFQQKVDAADDFLLNLRIQSTDGTLTAPLGALPSGVAIPDSLTSQVSYDAVNRQLVLVGNISATDEATLLGLSGDANYTAAVAQLFAAQTTPVAGNTIFSSVADINTKLRGLLTQPAPSQLPQRYTLLLNAIAPVYTTLLQQRVVLTELCSWFSINKDVAAALEQSQPGIYTDLTSAAFVGRANPLTIANYPAQFTWYRKIQRVCFVTAKLQLTATDLAWFLPNAVAVGSLDLWNLPTTPITGAITTFAAFQTLVNLLSFEQQFPAVQQVTQATTRTLSVYAILSEVLAGTALASIEADLAALTGWDQGQLDQLVNSPNYLNLLLTPSASSDLLSARILLRLTRCFQIVGSLGAAVVDCVAWTKPSLSYDDSTKIKQTLKAQTPDAQWLSVTQPLQDTLRQAKRDALVAYLIANPPAGETFATSDDLYDYFLIDVEMSPCQPTSRIIQATNSVQQFVQRCFLNLESQITVDTTSDPDWTQWDWMKNYRVWQANREIFLYPENYIEPTLLPAEIRSSFFDDLQNALLQNAVTEESVEDAFLGYLDSLDEVARLEIKAMWYDDQQQTLHVVGRTYGGDPKTYYYRQLVQNRRWTPWVKIDQDVASDHIVLTVFNSRIYLFWAVFTEQSDDLDQVAVPPVPSSSSGESFTPDKPPKYWQIQLAFSEYKNGKWTPKKLSNADETGSIDVYQYWDTSIDAYAPAKQDFIFTPLDLPQIQFQKYFNTDGGLKSADTFLSTLLQDVLQSLQQNGDLRIYCFLQEAPGDYELEGIFDLDPCKGYPVVADDEYAELLVTLFDQSKFVNMLDTAYDASEALSLSNNPILGQTVGQFANLVPLQMSLIDRLVLLIYIIYVELYEANGNSADIDTGTTTDSVVIRRGFPARVGTFLPFIYQDKTYTYYVRPELSDNGNFELGYQDLANLLLAFLEGNTAEVQALLAQIKQAAAGGNPIAVMDRFFNLYHPLVCFFMRTLFDNGIGALMSRTTQLKNDVTFDPSPDFSFAETFAPTGVVYSGANVTPPGTDPTPGYPKGDVDFTPLGAYSQYNWELFFHAPLMIAEQLDQNLQFEDAETWYRYIFNPTDGSSYPAPNKFWVTKPFFETTNADYLAQSIDAIMTGIDQNDSALIQDVTDWRNNPFQPHYIAQYRTVAYQKTTVMKYLDHLIAWGDSLFQQDTMESVMEAEQLYSFAQQILGPKPQIIPPGYERPTENYAQLSQNLDAFSNALVDIENLLPLQQVQGYDGVNPTQGLPVLATLYFCVPPNAQLLAYWDTVADRLYKIRNCLNLQGQLAPLALMAPPINPMLLVRAAAAGLDIGSILTDMNSPLPNYRFSTMVQKAIDVCSEAKSLGQALQSVMERKDAEDLALLRSKNGIAVLNAVLALKQQQVTEAADNLEALQAQAALIQVRIAYYQGLISGGLSSWEQTSLSLTQIAIAGEQSAVSIEYLGNILALIPDFDLGGSGFGGSPVVTAKFGGTQLGGATRALASAIRGEAGILHAEASIASTQATFQRRQAEWQFQLSLANAELQQVQKQIAAATVRQEIATQDVQNQQLQIANAQAEDAFMRDKFTSTDLYAWMIGQLSDIYFPAYQLAYAYAKQAEQTYRYEIGLADSSFINFGYWDSLHKGLLAADTLMSDIRSLDKAYHDQNARELELTKHVPLSQLDPAALQLLKSTGSCWVNLPEELFDMDYPGHYMRRIKSLAVTIPCVAGPYTTVSCKVTLTKNSLRVASTSTGSANTYPRKTTSTGAPADDTRFRDAVGAIQSIATSSGQNDDGLFELSFRDERYLPFECAGAISQWHLELPAPYPQLDYRTITDVILHLKYTARDGGAGLAADAGGSLKSKINGMLVALKDTGLMRAFSARHEFPTQWYAFLNPTSATADQELDLAIGADRFPYFASVANIQITSVELVADTTLSSISGVTLSPTPTNTPPLRLTADGAYGALLRLVASYGGQAPGAFTFKNPVANPRITASQINDLVVIVHYKIS